MPSCKRAATIDTRPQSRTKHFRGTYCLSLTTTQLAQHDQHTPATSCQSSTMDIAQPSPDTNIRWTYRVGSPELISYPFDTIRSLSVPQLECEVFEEKIHSILRDAGVQVPWTLLVKRFRAGMDIESTPFTLLIESDISIDGQYTCWTTAAASLRRLLDASGHERILVEIIDSRVAHSFSSRPLLGCTSDFISRWESCKPKLLAEIEDRDWLAIDIVEREFGIRSPFTVPTVLITTKDADNEIWRQRHIPNLRTLLPPPMDIDILYAPALIYGASAKSSDSEEIAKRPVVQPMGLFSTMGDYSAVVAMGASIGLDDPANSATVGAVIELRDSNGNETKCGLTNHHVVARETSLIEKNCPIGQSLGPNHPICRDGLVKVVAPSHSDHERFVNYLRKSRDECRETLNRLDKEYKHETLLYAHYMKQLHEANADLETLAVNPDRLFGTVWATSGYRVCNNENFSRTDRERFSSVKKREGEEEPSLQTLINGRTLKFGLNWALVKLAKNRELNEQPPITPSSFGMVTKFPANRYTRIEENKSYEVAKVGRTTGWTYGTISEIGSILNLRNKEDNVNIVPEDLTKRFGETNGIVLAYGVFHADKNRDFMLDGDSGSCVLLRESDHKNKKATIVGVLFASNELTRVSYMMPMDMVIRDIESVTGHTVTKPTFVEYAGRLA